MGVSSSYLSKTEVQDMLGVNAFGLWRLVRKYDNFPQPTEPPYDPFAAFGDNKDPEEVWDGTQLYRWAAKTPEFSHRGAVLLRPLPEDLTPGRWGGYKDTVRGPALDWHTALGTLRIVHNDDRQAAADVAADLTKAGNPDGVRVVCALYGDMGITGPALVAADTAHPGIEYEAGWGDVAALAGQPLPWWPDLLRLPELIREWKPGAPAAVVQVPANRTEKILRRVARNDAFDVTSHLAVTDMANDIRNDRTDNVEHENEIFGKEGYGETPNPVVIAAVPDTTGHPLRSGGDREVFTAGWRKLALSNHPDAVAALEVAVGREPGLLPYGALTEVPDRPGTIIETVGPAADDVRPDRRPRSARPRRLRGGILHRPAHRHACPADFGTGRQAALAVLRPAVAAGQRRGARLGSAAPHHVDHHQRRPRSPRPLHPDRAPVVGQRRGRPAQRGRGRR